MKKQVKRLTEKEKIIKKYRLYAIFQVFSNLSLVMISLFFFLVAYAIFKSDAAGATKISLRVELERAMTFDVRSSTILWAAAILFYCTILLYIATIMLGLAAIRYKSNSFDSLFILFLPLPLFSSFFCLVAQIVSQNTIKMTHSGYKLTDREIERVTKNIVEKLNAKKRNNNDQLIKNRHSIQGAKSRSKTKLDKSNKISEII